MKIHFPFPVFPRHTRLWTIIKSQITTTDLAHDALHVMRVYVWCMNLAEEAGASPDLAGACGLVHDLVHIPKNALNRSEGGALSAIAAEPALSQAGYTPSEIDVISDAVGTSSWSKGLTPNGPLGIVLQDADRLDAMGAIGIARTFATAQAMTLGNRDLSLYASHDPLSSKRNANDKKFAVDHFYVKLLQLKERMVLPSAQKEASRRHQTMVNYLQELKKDLYGSSD